MTKTKKYLAIAGIALTSLFFGNDLIRDAQIEKTFRQANINQGFPLNEWKLSQLIKANQ